MSRLYAIITIGLILLVTGYGTFELFRGNFVVMFATAPVMLLFYLYLAGSKSKSGKDSGNVR